MDSYKVRLSRDAEAEFRRIPFPFRRQINQRLAGLRLDPRPAGAERLAEAESYRYVVARWKILYAVDEAGRAVTVFAFVPPGP